jgi:diaminopimelate epimerase
MRCVQMSGAGNDFMVIDARGQTLDFSSLAKKLCKLTDADGFMALDHSEIGDFKLHFYNSDGSRGEMCGNGSRCICKFAYDNGITGEYMTVETDAGIVYGWRLDENRYKVKLNNPGIFDTNRKTDVAYVELGDPGIPHGVTELPQLSWEQKEDLREYAKLLRYDPVFPKGINVNFYRMLAEDKVRMLTYERGVENYTLACGTGCGSTAVTLFYQGRLPGKRLICENQGGELAITLETESNKITGLYLEGAAENIKEYEI